MSERDINQKVAEEICQGFRLNGQEFRLGECVALLDGKVVGVAKDLGAALRALRALDSNPHRGMIFEVGPPVVDVIRCELHASRRNGTSPPVGLPKTMSSVSACSRLGK